MYSAIKSNAINEDNARRIAGDEAVDKVLSLNCDFTGRIIDDCFDVYEMSASVEFMDKDGDGILTVLYLVDKDETDNTDDLGSLDYSDYTFTIS